MGPLPDLTPDQLRAYLDRIGIDPATPLGPVGPDLLARLQLAHLETVPFENLDIHLGRAIALDHDRIAAKVIERRRGGYCYELNSVFGRLLQTLGFTVTLVSARIPDDGGGLSPEFDHLALLVDTVGGDGTDTHLVDVGFGDAATAPLPLRAGWEGIDRWGRVRLVEAADHWRYEEDRGRGWKLWYRFTTTPQDLGAFEGMNRFQQSSPDSHFTGRVICSRLTPTGRATVSEGRLITTEVGDGPEPARTERALADGELGPVLADDFGVTVPARPELADVDPVFLDNPVATLATNGADGRPQLTTIWFGVEGGELCLSITESTQKARNLRADGRCSVLIHDPASTSRFVEIRGWAELTPDPGYAFADRLGVRYDTDFRSFDGPDASRLRVAIRPQRIVVTDVRG